MPALLARLHPDVDWPEAWSGGRVFGRAPVGEYVTHQTQDVRFRVEPLSVREQAPDVLAVTVHQVVRDVDDDVLSDTTVLHTLSLDGGLVRRLDVGEPPP